MRSGRAALREATLGEFDLVRLDLGLPVESAGHGGVVGGEYQRGAETPPSPWSGRPGRRPTMIGPLTKGPMALLDPIENVLDDLVSRF